MLEWGRAWFDVGRPLGHVRLAIPRAVPGAAAAAADRRDAR